MSNVVLILGAGALGLAVIATLVSMLFSVERLTVATARRRGRALRSTVAGNPAKQRFIESVLRRTTPTTKTSLPEAGHEADVALRPSGEVPGDSASAQNVIVKAAAGSSSLPHEVLLARALRSLGELRSSLRPSTRRH
jgi:hypothetical protein